MPIVEAMAVLVLVIVFCLGAIVGQLTERAWWGRNLTHDAKRQLGVRRRLGYWEMY